MCLLLLFCQYLLKKFTAKTEDEAIAVYFITLKQHSENFTNRKSIKEELVKVSANLQFKPILEVSAEVVQMIRLYLSCVCVTNVLR